MKHSMLLALILSLSCAEVPQQKEPVTLEDFMSNGEWIDLTYAYSERTVYWPSVTNTFKLDTIAYGDSDGGYFYSAYSYSAPEHGGTHLDAPAHFAKGKMSTDEIPLEHLMGNAVVIDVSEHVITNRDYLVTVDDITNWEKTNGRLPDDCILLFRTGFGKYYPDLVNYLGTAEKGEAGIANLHFPGISPALARWLVKNRQVKAVGIDTASVDYGQSKDFRAHRILYAANIPGFENVANLDQLPEKGAFVIALPMKIKGGSGGPLRMIAWVKN